MISIYRDDASSQLQPLNYFRGRWRIHRNEIVVKTTIVRGTQYRYAEPAIPGQWAYGGTLVHTDNGIYPELTEPLKLHDRDMTQEVAP